MRRLKILFLLGICLTLTPNVLPQKTQNTDLSKLNDQVLALHQQGKLDEAVKFAQEVVKQTQKSGEPQDLATAYLNLAALRKERFAVNKSKLFLVATPPKELSKAYRAAEEDGAEAERLFKNVIELYKDKIRTESAQLGVAQRELASMLYLYKPALTSEENQKERFQNARELFEAALNLHKKICGSESDITLATMTNLAEYYHFVLELGDALSLYEQILTVQNKKSGHGGDKIVPILWAYADALVATDQQAKAAEAVEKISVITGKKEFVPEANNELSLRVVESQRGKLRKITQQTVPKSFYNEPSTNSLSWQPVTVKVLVDENGKVVEAIADELDQRLKAKAESIVRSLNFKTPTQNGVALKLRGKILYARLELTTK